MRELLASLFRDLPPVASARLTAVHVVTMLLIALLAQLDMNPDTLDNLWLLYKALRLVKMPKEHRELFLWIVKDLPRDIQKDILREVKGLSDSGSVLLAEILAEQIRPEERLRVARHPYLPGGQRVQQRLG